MHAEGGGCLESDSKPLNSQALRNSEGNSLDKSNTLHFWADTPATTKPSAGFKSTGWIRALPSYLQAEKDKTNKQPTKHLALLNRFLKEDKQSCTKIKRLIYTGTKH